MKPATDNLPFWRCWGAEPRQGEGRAPARLPREPHPAFIACRMLLGLSLLTGLIYPLVVTGIVQVAVPSKATGSIVRRDGQAIGSELLAQRFAAAHYFWPRPSAGDDGTIYATVPSSASNLGPTSSNLVALVRARADKFRVAHRLTGQAAVPSEMLFASGSGLDPHISPASARWQIQRVAQARQFDAAQAARLRQLVEECVERPQLGFLGEPRVNVLRLNLRLDQLQ